MNKVIFIGNVVRDWDVKVSASGNTVASSCIAVNGDKKDDPAMFVNLVAFGKTGEILSTYTAKGSKIMVEGKLDIKPYVNKDGEKKIDVKVIVREFEFVGSKKDGGAPAQKQNTGEFVDIPNEIDVTNEAIPFSF